MGLSEGVTRIASTTKRTAASVCACGPECCCEPKTGKIKKLNAVSSSMVEMALGSGAS